MKKRYAIRERLHAGDVRYAREDLKVEGDHEKEIRDRI